MRILIVKNESHEGGGIFQEELIKLNIPYDVIDLNTGDTWPHLEKYDGLIVMGGSNSANDGVDKMTTEVDKVRQWLKTDKPYLGICLGLQVMVKAAGGTVVKNTEKEVGFRGSDGQLFSVTLCDEAMNDQLLKNIPKEFNVFHLHGETVIPNEKVEILGTGISCRNQIAKVGRHAYGLQFHCELTAEMFNDWKAKDPWLQEINQPQLTQDWLTENKNMATITQTLMRNFLALIEQK